MRVPDADAIAEGTNPGRVGDLPPDLLNHEVYPGVIGRQDTFKRGDVVSLATPPRHVAQVQSVVNTEVGEGRQVFLIDRVPKPELGGDSAVEVAQYVETVTALRRSSKAEEFDWLEVIEQGLVRRRRGVVELGDDHDVEVGGVDVADVGGVQTLNRRKDVLELSRPLAGD